MRVALLSFEFPPAVTIGGIGTYAWEASRMLAAAGVSIEVFSAGVSTEEPAELYGILVHRVAVSCRVAFRESILPLFSARHLHQPFDLIESPEIGAEAAWLTHAFPELAIVCKLHTPSYLVRAVGHESPSFLDRLRFRLGALRRGRLAGLKQEPYSREHDVEWVFARSADEIAAPSQAIADQLSSDWDLDLSRISVFPLPFKPDPALLSLPIPSSLTTVGFLGRLEARKGVAELARAIPLILRHAPKLHFRFIGPSWPYRKSDMQSWISQHCRPFLDRITFSGPVKTVQLSGELERCEAVVLPSRWESFGLACPEAMAAGRAVIGSSAGGMAEVIQPGVNGLLVPPHSPKAIASAVLSLLGHPELVSQLGAAARKRVLEHLAPERILPLQLASYERAIARARLRQ